MSAYSDLVRDRSEEILERTEPSEAERLEHEERARRNRIDAIMAAPSSLSDLNHNPLILLNLRFFGQEK